MGASQSVHMANASGKKIWFLIASDPEAEIYDALKNFFPLLAAANQLKFDTGNDGLPEDPQTLADLFRYMQFANKLIWDSINAYTRPSEAVLSLIDAFKGVAGPINAGEAPDVSDPDFLKQFLTGIGIEILRGAKTVRVMIMSDDGQQFAWFGSDSDYSWIATDHEKIVRSKDGSIWQEDPGAGSLDWPAPPPPPPQPVRNDCTCGSHCTWKRGPFECLCEKDNCFC